MVLEYLCKLTQEGDTKFLENVLKGNITDDTIAALTYRQMEEMNSLAPCLDSLEEVNRATTKRLRELRILFRTIEETKGSKIAEMCMKPRIHAISLVAEEVFHGGPDVESNVRDFVTGRTNTLLGFTDNPAGAKHEAQHKAHRKAHLNAAQLEARGAQHEARGAKPCHKSCTCGKPVKVGERACHKSCTCGKPVKVGERACHELKSCTCGKPVKVGERACHELKSCTCGKPVKVGERACHELKSCTCGKPVKVGENACHSA
jgi:hypothetical protein